MPELLQVLKGGSGQPAFTASSTVQTCLLSVLSQTLATRLRPIYSGPSSIVPVHHRVAPSCGSRRMESSQHVQQRPLHDAHHALLAAQMAAQAATLFAAGSLDGSLPPFLKAHAAAQTVDHILGASSLSCGHSSRHQAVG